MISLLMIADDFTGAMDTGVQFAARGLETRVVVSTDGELSAPDPEVQVLVVDAETRHLKPEAAYEVVAKLTRQAVDSGVPYIYKKTDSALRGNIGAELTALLRTSGASQLFFLPAYPQMGRTTEGGIHLVNGVPVAESVFGQDPFEPVRHSSLTELIAEQSDVPVHISPVLGPDDPVPAGEGILVFDSRTPEDLAATGQRLREAGELRVMAGCAGFGMVLPALLGLASDRRKEELRPDERLLVFCGSVNPITVAQMAAAERAGVARWQMTPEQKLQPDYWLTEKGQAEFAAIREGVAQHSTYIIDTNDKERNRLTDEYAQQHGIDIDGIRLGVSRSIGYLVEKLFTDPNVGTLLITGGDTLLQCMNLMGVREVEPVREMTAGVVLSRVSYKGCTHCVLTKSGGFGQETLVTDLAEMLARP